MSLSCRITAKRGDFALDFGFETGATAVAVVGPSGSGKTTFLQGLAGLIPTGVGRLVIDGEAVVDSAGGLSPPAHRRRLGYVFQDGRLFPHMTVGGNIAFARAYARDPRSVEEALTLLDLKGLEGRWPATLSGGEARRVAIARALCADPRLLLLDEPFTGLDARRRDRLTPYLQRLRDELGLPMILVSHDPRDIEAVAEQVFEIAC